MKKVPIIKYALKIPSGYDFHQTKIGIEWAYGGFLSLLKEKIFTGRKH